MPLRPDRPLAVELAQMSPAQRRHAYRSGLFDPRRRALWASLYPEEPPLVNGEFEWIALHLADPGLSLDVFAYDFDEPDVVRRLAALGPRLRLFLDDSDQGEGTAAAERKAEAVKVISAGAIQRGDFKRYAHDKIFIQKRNGRPVTVLSGSANFSVRGLYVQSNNVFLFDDPSTAEIYERAFEQACNDPGKFSKEAIAEAWFPEARGANLKLPDFAVSFAPHADTELSLHPVAEAIEKANSSVLFSIMDIDSGGGPVLDRIRELPSREELYAFGTTQDLGGSLKVTSAGTEVFIPFEYLHSKVPQPFREEIRGGTGQVIHHKFVVVDFNDEHPVAFAGSSNLRKGGEEDNGDNLLEFRDPAIATIYAVEAIRLIDHYRFRAAMKEATPAEPLRLKTRSEQWSRPFFEPGTRQCRERELFAKGPFPR